jgi:1,4-alpha-glucan branching enzyme
MKIKAKQAVKQVATTKTAVKAVAKTVAKPLVKTPVKATKTTAKKGVAKTERVTFSVRAEVGSKVFLAGSFNNWDPTAKEMVDKKGDGVFVVTLSLPVGSHQYKFVIDGTWCADPDCADWMQNDHGTLNSVKHVS